MIKNNYKILKEAIGKEPWPHILGNAVRKILGKTPMQLINRRMGGIIYSNDPEYNIFRFFREEANKKRRPVEEIAQLDSQPQFSIIWQIDQYRKTAFQAALKQINEQKYPNWNLTIICTSPVLKIIEPFTKKKDIKFVEIGAPVSGCELNQSIQNSTGEYVVLMHDMDLLHSFALLDSAKKINEGEVPPDVCYLCEDQMDDKGLPEQPLLKPQFNSAFFYSSDFVKNNLIIRRSFGDSLNWFQSKYGMLCYYDFVLRADEVAGKIARINEIAYTRTGSQGGVFEKEDLEMRNSILAAYFQRKGEAVSIFPGLAKGSLRVKRVIKDSKKVSIIIPFRDKVELLKVCVETIYKYTTYPNFEIILANNNSVEKTTLDYLDELAEKYPNCKKVDIVIPFNFSKINNIAVEHSSGAYLLFLNNDIEIIHEGWLEALVAELQDDRVGVVGAKLLYGDQTLQHAGVLVGVGDVAGHAFRGSLEEDGYMQRIQCIQSYSAVTAACLLTTKQLFETVEGFNENELKVSNNDVDFCLKVRKSGYQVIYTPYSKLIHHESQSRKHDLTPSEKSRYEGEVAYMWSNWEKELKDDPFSHPDCFKTKEDFSINIDFDLSTL